MRTSTAYFAGVGTVIFAVAVGLGGGYLAANIVSPHEPKYGAETSKLERRVASEPSAAATAVVEPARHITATQPATPVATQASVSPTANPAVQPAVAVTTPAIEAASEASLASQQSVATTRASDARRAGVEKRRAERRQRSAEKRRAKQLREQELDAVEQRIGEVSEPRQAFAFGPPRGETQRIMLFGAD